MKAWNIDKTGVNLIDSSPTRKQGEVKLKLLKVALSPFDLRFLSTDEGRHPKVPGHSAVAYVSEADDDSGLLLGSRVVISPFIETEENGEPTVKTMGVDVDGLLSDFICVPQQNVFPLPDGITDEEAVFVDYIAMGNRAIEAMKSGKGDYVVIVGASTLGLILCQLANYYQLVPILVDLDTDKLERARSWDVVYTLNPTYDDLEKKVEQITGGRMCEAAMFVGEGMGLNAALRLVKKKGEVIIAGYSFHKKHQVDMNTILKRQLNIMGVCNGAGEIPSAINILANRFVQTDGFIGTHTDFMSIPHITDECVKYPIKFSKILVSME